jgi:site-specific DNA-adenine methylase
MILRRIGNKQGIADKIQQYFPQHTIYIEPFFGAGGMFFNKPKAKYNIVNDLDSDVFNLFQVVSNQKDELEHAFFNMPIHTDYSLDDRGNGGRNTAFIYCDPPYLNTTDKYEMEGWKEQDVNDLFNCLIETGCKFAYSEFDHPFIIKQAETRNLNLITIGERQNLKNRRTEILITNYKNAPTLFS